MNSFDAKTVTEHEHGVLRVFFLDDVPEYEPGGIQAMKAFWAAIGLPNNGLGDVQIVNASYFPDGLRAFLKDGYGLSDKDLFEHGQTLDAFKGFAAIVRSSSFDKRPVTLTVDGSAKLIAAYHEDGADTAFPSPISTLGAMGVLTPPPAKKKPSDAAMGGRVATIALLVMGLLVWVMIKVGG
ncbi:MAG: hypothetical protein ACSHWY_04500 [Octadecabacter sp.]